MSDLRKIEAETEKKFVAYARTRGCVCIKGELFGSCHWPDQLILLPNREFFWIEFKRDGEEPRPGQYAKHRELKHKGHDVYWTDQYEVAKALLDEKLEV